MTDNTPLLDSSNEVGEILAKFWLDATSSQNMQPYIAATVKAKTAINQLIIEARTDELEHIHINPKTHSVFYAKQLPNRTTGLMAISERIDQLRATLNNRKGDT